MIWRKILQLIASLVVVSNLCSAAFAAPNWQTKQSSITALQAQNSPVDAGTYSHGLKVNPDDMTQEQIDKPIKLTPDEQHQAKVWQLTQAQEQRYLMLMQNRSQINYAGRHLSPVWMLGLNARTQPERMYYAKLAAKQEMQLIAQNLAWNSAYHDAFKQLTKGMPLVKPYNVAKFSPYSYQPAKLVAHDSLSLFTTVKAPVTSILVNLLMSMRAHPSVQLNIYIVGKSLSNDDIQHWANEHSIPVQWVSDKRITLNNGNAAYNRLVLKSKTLPILILLRDGKASLVDTGRF